MENITNFALILLSNVATQLQVTNLLYMVHRLRQRRLVAQIFSSPYVDTDVYRRMAVNNRRQRRKRRFWVRQGRTAVWCKIFLDNIAILEEWRENFRMSTENFYKLCDEHVQHMTSQILLILIDFDSFFGHLLIRNYSSFENLYNSGARRDIKKR